MRDIKVSDSELRLLVAVHRTARELGNRVPNTALIDQLLDERAAAAAPETLTQVTYPRGSLGQLDHTSDGAHDPLGGPPHCLPVQQVAGVYAWLDRNATRYTY